MDQMEVGEKDSAATRLAKAYMNMALTKSMSSNHRQAMALCDRALPIIQSMSAVVDIKPSQSLAEKATSSSAKNVAENKHAKITFKYWFKKATL